MVHSVAFGLALLAAGGPPAEPFGPPAPLFDRNNFPLPSGAVARLGDHGRRHRVPGDWASFSDDDKLVARPVDGTVRIFDLDRKRDVTPGYLADYPNAVLRFLADGRHLLFNPATKRCDVRDPATGEVALGFEVPATAVEALTPSGDGRRVFVRYRDPGGYSTALVADLSGSRSFATASGGASRLNGGSTARSSDAITPHTNATAASMGKPLW